MVQGDVDRLRLVSGDFELATPSCLADDTASTSVAHAAITPALGDATWFLARPAACGIHGTYDTGSPSQAAPRDAGIAASRVDCP